MSSNVESWENRLQGAHIPLNHGHIIGRSSQQGADRRQAKWKEKKYKNHTKKGTSKDWLGWHGLGWVLALLWRFASQSFVKCFLWTAGSSLLTLTSGWSVNFSRFLPATCVKFGEQQQNASLRRQSITLLFMAMVFGGGDNKTMTTWDFHAIAHLFLCTERHNVTLALTRSSWKQLAY